MKSRMYRCVAAVAVCGVLAMLAVVSSLATPVAAEEGAADAVAEKAPAGEKEKAGKDQAGKAKEKTRPQIQMAILLDTSSSMAGLINQARTQLWDVVNELAATKRGGQRPDVKVALFEYGKNSLPEEDGFTRLVVPLTTDLDKISEELFALQQSRPNSSERCGQVIDRAVRDLKWSENSRDLKCIFIAGNEAFTQGPVDFRKACQAAADRGITISTIFCGGLQQGRSLLWAEGAKLADGSFMSIDHNQAVPDVEAPQDAELARLNAELNKSYVAYGASDKRDEFRRRQLTQDANAARAAPAAAAARAEFKSSDAYRNEERDLVDGYLAGKVKVEELPKDQLPKELQELKPDERKKYIEKKAKARAAVQEKIKQLTAQRNQYIAAEREKLRGATDRTLGKVLVEAARKQADAKQFRRDPPPKSAKE